MNKACWNTKLHDYRLIFRYGYTSLPLRTDYTLKLKLWTTVIREQLLKRTELSAFLLNTGEKNFNKK